MTKLSDLAVGELFTISGIKHQIFCTTARKVKDDPRLVVTKDIKHNKNMDYLFYGQLQVRRY